MANYYINIIDTQNSDYTTVLENAVKQSIVLSYKGSDAKDELDIVGSTLKFTILVDAADNVDAAFSHLFTGDEQRYKIEIRKETDDTLIWHGFSLPDSYSEPYKAGTLTIDVTATDGLGRLKGKFLPDTFYSQEHKVTDIISECLKLTGLEMPFYFCPSIENYHQPRFDTIYIKGTDFLSSKGKQDDAYKILKYLAEDLLFCVFQSMGYWHLEGLNKRNLLTYSAYEYDADGVYVQDVELTRNVKVIQNHTLKTPVITTVVPYGRVIVDHDREPVDFLPEQSREQNDGWAVSPAVNPQIYASKWWGPINVFATAPDYNIFIPNSNTNTFNSGSYTALAQKIYLKKDDKYKITFNVEVIDSNTNEINNIVTSWQDPIEYKITLNDNTLFSNNEGTVTTAEKIIMTNTKTAELSFEFVVPQNGLLDFVLYKPYKTGEYIDSVGISGLKLEQINGEDTETFVDVVNEDYTVVKEKELTFADDAAAYSKAFMLDTFANTQTAVQYTIPILYSFTQNNKYYSAVDLAGANLVKDNINDVSHDTETVDVIDVVYNYAGSEQMVVETDFPNLTGNFIVLNYRKEQGPSDRDDWLEWTDSVYGIEKKRFGEVHSKIYRRMFTIPHVKADVAIKMPVLFNDIVQWPYSDTANYNISNLKSWDLDKGVTQLTINQAVYQNDEDVDTGGDNVPPIVVAMDDLYIADGISQVTLQCVASDPDGFITNYQWSEVSGTNSFIISQPNNQNTNAFVFLSEDFFTFQIEVTDNDGATATDTVNVIRLGTYQVNLTEIDSVEVNDTFSSSLTKTYSLTTTPALPDNFNLNIEAVAEYELEVGVEDQERATARVEIVKNNNTIVYEERELLADQPDYNETLPIPFGFNNTDDVDIIIRAFVEDFNDLTTLEVRSQITFRINNVTFVTGDGTITTTFPLQESVERIWTP